MIYLDNNATTVVDPRVAQAVYEELLAPPSNPSSLHALGRAAKQRLIKAREEIAAFFAVSPKEVIFTSGGTESMNFLLHGFTKKHVITSDIEHSCVYETLKKSPHVSFLKTGLKGFVSAEQVQAAITPETSLIVLSAANSETGVKNPLEEIGELALSAKIPLIVDGVGLLGKELFTLPKGVRGMGFSGHKFHGPKGIGCVLLKDKLSPLLIGGDQEYGLRSGTENLPGIIGFAKAITLLKEELPKASLQMCTLRNLLEQKITSALRGVSINGEGPRVCNTSNLSFEGVGGEDLLISLDLAGVAVSHGSACASGALEPSRVLRNMGIPLEHAKSAIRFSLSRYTTLEEIERCASLLIPLVQKMDTGSV